jgi:hypothetical protein
VEQLADWICGRTPPPRHSEGLNDPMSIAAVLHFALTAQENSPDPLAVATLKVLRSLLDDRAEAALWAATDLLNFGPAFREAEARMEAPYPASTLQALAERVMETQAALAVPSTAGTIVTSIDGRELYIEPKSFGTLWLVASFLPRALVAAGLTERVLPTLVWLPRFLPASPDHLAEQLEGSIAASTRLGLDDLDRLEKRLKTLPAQLKVTKRSKAPTLYRLTLAYPELRIPAIARLLGISHQGATKLKRRLEHSLKPI